VKRDAEQATLAAEQYPPRDIQKGRRLEHAVPDHPDSPRLLDDEYQSVVERLSEKNRTRETGRYEWIEPEGEARR
jgi:hypothetical protein